MFRNLLFFKVPVEFVWPADVGVVQQMLEGLRFQPCSPSQANSFGWVEPRGEANGPLLESVDREWMLRVHRQTKVLPSSVVKDEVTVRVTSIERETGRKPGKKQKKEISEHVMFDLLPRAFTKNRCSFVWIDRETGTVAIESGALADADEMISLLVKSFDGLTLRQMSTQLSPASAMAFWLSENEAPAGFSTDRECVLRSFDESKATVRYSNHALDIDEIKSHITAGKMPVSLALTWQNSISFVLNDSSALTKLAFLDVLFEGPAARDSGFDADVSIATGSLKKLLPDLSLALGGIQE